MMPYQDNASTSLTGKKLFQLGTAIVLAFVLVAAFLLFPIIAGTNVQIDSFEVTLPFGVKNVYATNGLTITKKVVSNLPGGSPTNTLYVAGNGSGIVTYTLTVTNNTPDDLDVTITDTVPAGTVCTGIGFNPLPSSGWTAGTFCASGLAVWDSGADLLASGATAVLTFSASVNPAGAGRVIENDSYQIDAISVPGGVSYTDVGTTVPITIAGPAYEISKQILSGPTATVGSNIQYRITITNIGTLTNSVPYEIRDTYPNGTTYNTAAPAPDSAGPPSVVWDSAGGPLPATLNPGQSTTVTPTFLVNDPTLLAGDAIVNSSYYVTSTEIYTSYFGPSVTVTVASAITLTVGKTDVVDPVEPGDFITYTIVITNDGTNAVTGVVVTDTLPLALPGTALSNTFVSATAQPNPGALVVDSSSLPNLVMSFTPGYTIASGNAVALMVVISTPNPLPTSYIVTNQVTAGLTSLADTTLVVTGDLAEATTIQPINLITLSKSVTTPFGPPPTPPHAQPGDVVNYTVVLNNSGTGIADVTLTDVLPTPFLNSLIFPPNPTFAVSPLQDYTYKFSAIVGDIDPTTDLLTPATEPFNAGPFANGWSANPVAGGPSIDWTTDTGWINPAFAGFGSGNFANIGNWNPQTDDLLLSPPMDASSCDLVSLEFSNRFYVYDQSYGTAATVEVGNGVITSTFLTLQDFSEQNNQVLDITSIAAGQNPLRIGFRFTSPVGKLNVNQMDYWAIDNVRVRCMAAATVDTNIYGAQDYPNTAITATYGLSTAAVINTAPVRIDDPAITMTKTATWAGAPAGATVGTVITYTYTISNIGTVPVNITQLVDDRLPSLDPTDLTVNPIPAIAGNVATATILHTVSAADLLIDPLIITNTAAATGTWGPETVTATTRYTVPLNLTPAISMSKTAQIISGPNPGRTSPSPQSVIRYTYYITNNSLFTVSLTSLTDDRIAGNLLTSPPVNLGPNGSGNEFRTETVIHNLTLAEIDIASGTGFNLINTAVVTGQDIYQGRVATDTDTASVPVTYTAQIQVLKSTPSVTVSLGGTVAYTYSIQNTGNVTMTGVALYDDPLFTGGTSLGALGRGASTTSTTSTVIGTVQFNQGGAGYYCNGSGVDGIALFGLSATDGGGSTPSRPGSLATEGPQDECVEVDLNFDLVFTKTAQTSTAPANPTLGDTITYTYEVENTGDISFTGTLDDDYLPSFPVGVPGIAPGGLYSTTVVRVVTVGDINNAIANNSTNPYIRNVAVVTASASAPYGWLSDEIRTDAVTVGIDPSVSVALDKSATWLSMMAPARVGDVVTYTFTVTNTGAVSLTGVTLTDNPFHSGPPINQVLGTLNPNQSTVYIVPYTVALSDLQTGLFPYPAPLSNTATVTGNTVLSSPWNQAAISDTETVPLIYTLDVDIDKVVTTPAPQPVPLDTVITYTYYITNNSDVPVDYLITDDQEGTVASGILNPTGQSGSTASPTVLHTITTGDITALIGGMAPLTNVATVVITDRQVDTTATDVASDTVVVMIDFNPTISLTKTVNPTSAVVGDVITYTFYITNTGLYTLNNVTLTDPKISLNQNLGTLLPSGNTTVVYPYTLLATDAPPVTFTNIATASGATATTPPFIVTATATATAIVSPSALLDIAKTPTWQQSPIDTAVNYTYRMTNSTTASVINLLDMADDKIPGVSVSSCFFGLSSLPLAPGADVSCTKSDTYTEADLISSAADGFVITNTLTVTSTDGLATFAYTTTAATELIFTKGIDVEKVADTGGQTAMFPGDIITYTFNITNTGDITLYNVSLFDALPGAVSPPVSTTMLAGASTMAQLTHTVTTSDANACGITNTAIITGYVTTAQVATATDASTAVVRTEALLPPVNIVPEPFPSPMAQIPATFTATFVTPPSTCSDPIVYTWSFGEGAGDGPNSGINTGVHTYPVSTIGQTFTVVVTATSSSGASTVTDTLIVTILDTPITSLTATNSSPAPVRQFVDFTAVATGTPAPTNVEYSWAYGDGFGTTSPVFSNTYDFVQYQNYLEPGNYTATVVARNTSSILIATTLVTITPGITITKFADPPSGSVVEFGNRITYTIIITNLSGIPLMQDTYLGDGYNVITDVIDSNLNFVTASVSILSGVGTTPTWGQSGQTITASTPFLLQSASMQLVIVTEVAANSGLVTNTAQSLYDQPGYPVPNTRISVPVGPSNEVTHTMITPQSIITLTKTADPASGQNVRINEPITYTIRIENDTSQAASGVVITDTLTNATYDPGTLSISPGGVFAATGPVVLGAESTFVFTATTVPAFSSYTVTFRAIVSGTGVTSGTLITNTVVGTSSNAIFTGTPTTTIHTAGDPILYIYLPIIYKNYIKGPDLVIDNIVATSDTIQVAIKNIGDADANVRTDIATVNTFWVDFYISPTPPPTQHGDIWNDGRSNVGVAWRVTQSPIVPSQVITLTCGFDPGTNPKNGTNACTGLDVIQKDKDGNVTTNFTGTLLSGLTLYAHVDSICTECTDGRGAVIETHEMTGSTYNNISDGSHLSLSISDVGVGVWMPPLQQSSTSTDSGPGRE